MSVHLTSLHRARPSPGWRSPAVVVALAVAVLVTSAASPPRLMAQRGGSGPPGWSGAGEIYWGGSVNVRFGRTSGIGLYPLVGYKITSRWSAGIRIGYEIWWRSRFSETITTHAFAGSLFSRFRIVPQVYAHAEGGAGNYNRILISDRDERVTYPFLFLGGGFSQPLARRTWLLMEVLYEVIQDRDSPYRGGGPIISVGFGVGF